MKSNTTTTGVGLPTILFIVFLILKLTNNIDWSWWWVTSPIWAPVAILFALILLILFLIFGSMILGFSPKKIESKIKEFKERN